MSAGGKDAELFASIDNRPDLELIAELAETAMSVGAKLRYSRAKAEVFGLLSETYSLLHELEIKARRDAGILDDEG